MPLLSYLVIKYRFVIAGPNVLYICFARLTYAIKQVGGVFQSDTQPHHCVIHLHIAPFVIGECDEDGACRMYGECLAVEEVRCTPYDFQPVDE